jgi:hypothetical protein
LPAPVTSISRTRAPDTGASVSASDTSPVASSHTSARVIVPPQPLSVAVR